MNLNKYTKTELAEISRILKKYKALRKNVWKKWSEIIKSELTWKIKVEVEYFPSLWKEEIKKTSLEIFEKVLNIKPNEEEIIWKENLNLKWWIRLFHWDEMLDISFESIKNNLKI